MNTNKTAPYTAFGVTRDVPLKVLQHGETLDTDTWDETLWIEREESWYALMSPQLRGKKVRIVERSVWLDCPETFDSARRYSDVRDTRDLYAFAEYLKKHGFELKRPNLSPPPQYWDWNIDQVVSNFLRSEGVNTSFLEEPVSTTAIRFRDWCVRNADDIRAKKRRPTPLTTGELYWIWEKQAK